MHTIQSLLSRCQQPFGEGLRWLAAHVRLFDLHDAGNVEVGKRNIGMRLSKRMQKRSRCTRASYIEIAISPTIEQCEPKLKTTKGHRWRGERKENLTGAIARAIQQVRNIRLELLLAVGLGERHTPQRCILSFTK